MRFLRPFLSILTVSSVTGRAKALRQNKGPATDLCANVNGHVELLETNPKLDGCLCASAIPDLISTNPLLKTAAQLQGISAVTAAVTALINAADDVQHCTFPAHAVPRCDSHPCSFTCTDGFTPDPPEDPTNCICNGNVCNDVCGSSPCSSQMAKRGAHWRPTSCPRGWSVCGIWGSSKFDYECVDVRRDLWSCGGCEFPSLKTDPAGVDCTAIPGVMDVVCLDSRCVVQRCKEGFDVSPDRASCIPIPCPKIPDDPAFVNNGDRSSISSNY